MEWLFRRHFWIVHLVFLAICAGILAMSVNAVIGYQLAKSFAVVPRKEPVRIAETKVAERDFSIANERNLFGAKRENVSPVDLEPDEGAGETGRWEDAVATTLRARLVGTAVFFDPRYSLAAIEDLRQGLGVTAQSYSINECLEKTTTIDPLLVDILGPSVLNPVIPCNRLLDIALIRRIETTRVYFYNEQEKRYEYLAMDEGLSPIKPMPSPVSTPVSSLGGGAQEYGKSVRKIGPTSYEIDAADLDSALGNLSDIATQARVVPAFEDGKPIGFKMFSIRPGSVFEKIGLKNGDIVTGINGYPLNDPGKGLELYQKFRTDTQFNMDVKSGGKDKTTYQYSIVGRGP